MPTFTAKLPTVISSFLDAQDELYGRIEKDIFTRVNRGETISVVEKLIQSKHGVDSTKVRNVWHNLKGKIDAVKKLRDNRIADLKGAIASVKRKIKAKEKTLTKLRKDNQPSWEVRHEIHGKKRKLATRQSKLDKVLKEKKSNRVSIAFGSKKLFNSQYHTQAMTQGDKTPNEYVNHSEWLAAWRDARSGNFMMVGNKIYSSGNQLCKLTQDGTLTINVPFPLLKRFGPTVSASNISFEYGQGWINKALEPVRRIGKGKKKSSRIGSELPVTHRFVRKDHVWYLHTHVAAPEIPTFTSKRNGAIGVDLNATSLDWVYCDNQGNLKHHGTISLVSSEMTTHQCTDAISKAIGEIVILASTFECPIVIEKLDFSKKKATLGEQGKQYSRMLSSFAYSKFSDLMESKCYRGAIQLIRVNPAYSSLIGLTKYMAMYGLKRRHCRRFSPSKALSLVLRAAINLHNAFGVTSG